MDCSNDFLFQEFDLPMNSDCYMYKNKSFRSSHPRNQLSSFQSFNRCLVSQYADYWRLVGQLNQNGSFSVTTICLISITLLNVWNFGVVDVPCHHLALKGHSLSLRANRCMLTSHLSRYRVSYFLFSSMT